VRANEVVRRDRVRNCSAIGRAAEAASRKDVMVTTSATYDPTAEAPHESRELVREFLADQDADDLSPAGELLVTELVSNVVRHARTSIELDLEWDDDTLRVEVRDGSSILPAVVELGNKDGGYGLRLVEALAHDWGVRPLDHGKAIWCTVSRRSGGA
jgi:anti-sigma regulatory factor (Ser/Thr protein kinase)